MSEQTKSTPSTGTLQKLSEANAQLAEESTALMARNAALEENTLHVQAELRKREEQLVEAGKDAEVVARECEALRAANTELLEEVEELQRKLDDLRTEEEINAESTYEANKRADELEWDNTRLRRAPLEQATCFATTLKALVPQA